jgi:lipid A disaccharide synthetase
MELVDIVCDKEVGPELIRLSLTANTIGQQFPEQPLLNDDITLKRGISSV